MKLCYILYIIYNIIYIYIYIYIKCDNIYKYISVCIEKNMKILNIAMIKILRYSFHEFIDMIFIS